MTVIRPNSISGINSITAQSNALAFYDVAGNKLNIDSDITGDVTGNLTGNVTVATGATISGSTNTITALTNGSERLRIDSNGFMRHGVISGGTYNGNITFAYNDRYPSIEYRKGGTIDGRLWKDVNNGYFLFENVTNGFIFESSNSEALRISSGGNVQIANGNLVFSTSGTGIDFSATDDGTGASNVSELLDDYEEGTFDPTVSMTASGSLTLQSSYNTLSYTKIGRLVTISGQIRIDTVSSPVGNILITNIPYTVRSTTELGRAGGGLYYFDNSAGVGNYYKPVSWAVVESSSTLYIYTQHSGGGITPGAADEIGFSCTYVAA